VPVTPTLAAGPIDCSHDLATEQPDGVIYGADAGDFLADRFALATGDFNGDGRDDLLIGAPLADGPDNARRDAGEAYVILGTESPEPRIDLAETAAALTVIGEASGDNLGFAVASGDINGDGKDDVIVGARFAGTEGRLDAGKAYVVFGADDLEGATIDTLDGGQDMTVIGQDEGDFLGIAVGSGDVNGDGSDDLVVGASAADGPAEDRSGAGAVYAVSGSSDPPEELDLSTGEPLFTIHGAHEEDSLPNTVASGDLDGDGKEELVLAAPFAEGGNPDRDKAGEAYIVSVPDEGASLDLRSGRGFTRISGADPHDQFGFYVAASDVNGDGTDDAIIGARDADGPQGGQRNNAGEVQILFGSSDLPDRVELKEGALDATIYGVGAGDSLGFTAASGDIDGDGTGDVLAGAPLGDGCDDSLPDAGELYTVAGGSDLKGEADLARGEFSQSIYGGEAGDSLAFSLTTGDFNGDGKEDVIAGALLADGPDNERQDAGEVYIILSR